MKTADRVPKDWLEKTLVDQPEVRAAFVDEAVNLYKSGDIDQGTLLQLMRTAIAAQKDHAKAAGAYQAGIEIRKLKGDA